MSTDFGLVALISLHARHASAMLDSGIVLRTVTIVFDSTVK